MAWIGRLVLLVLAVVVAVMGSGCVAASASASAATDWAMPGFVYDRGTSPTTGRHVLHEGASRAYDDRLKPSWSRVRGSASVLAAKEVGPTVGELRAAGQADAHYIIQDAAVRDVPGYATNAAPGVRLTGPSREVGSPHYLATKFNGRPVLAERMGLSARSLPWRCGRRVIRMQRSPPLSRAPMRTSAASDLARTRHSAYPGTDQCRDRSRNSRTRNRRSTRPRRVRNGRSRHTGEAPQR